MQRLRADGLDPALPPCDAPYLADYLFEIGPSASGGMGDGPIGHGDIAAWMANTGIRLTPWEARTLRRLSVDYVAESHKATKRNCPAPWQSDEFEVDKAVAGNVTKNALRDLAKL